jgi:hypothetical protein
MPVASPELADFPLSKGRRRTACIHEAGHAVISAISGEHVYRVAVAPEGDPGSWTFRGRRGRRAERGLLGVCRASGGWLMSEFLGWNKATCCYEADRQGFEDHNRLLAEFMASSDSENTRKASRYVAAEMRRSVRGHLCGFLAGRIAEQINEGRRDYRLTARHEDQGDDLVRAGAIARILPSPRREIEHALGVVDCIFRKPSVWRFVVGLADELERVGDIKDLGGLLPDPQPDWPPPPPRRASTPKARASR